MSSNIRNTARLWTTALVLSSVTTLSLATYAQIPDKNNFTKSLTLTGPPLGMHGIDPVSTFHGEKRLRGFRATSRNHRWFVVLNKPNHEPIKLVHQEHSLTRSF